MAWCSFRDVDNVFLRTNYNTVALSAEHLLQWRYTDCIIIIIIISYSEKVNWHLRTHLYELQREHFQLKILIITRDVPKFEFDSVPASNIFNRFKIRRIFQVLCCRMRIRGKLLFCDWFHMHREHRQTCFFLRFNLLQKLGLQLLNVHRNLCSVMCYMYKCEHRF